MTLEDFNAAKVGDRVRAFICGRTCAARIFHKSDVLQTFALLRTTKTGAVLFACAAEWCYPLCDSPDRRLTDSPERTAKPVKTPPVKTG